MRMLPRIEDENWVLTWTIGTLNCVVCVCVCACPSVRPDGALAWPGCLPSQLPQVQEWEVAPSSNLQSSSTFMSVVTHSFHRSCREPCGASHNSIHNSIHLIIRVAKFVPKVDCFLDNKLSYVHKWKVSVCQALQTSDDAPFQVSAADIYPMDSDSLIME